MSKRRTAAVLAAVLAATITAVVSPAGPAAAAPPCSAGYLCVWENTGYTGARAQFGGFNRDWSAFRKSTGGTWNNVASSGYNNGTTGLVACLYNGTDYNGTAGYICLLQHEALSSFSTRGFDNKASSNNWR